MRGKRVESFETARETRLSSEVGAYQGDFRSPHQRAAAGDGATLAETDSVTISESINIKRYFVALRSLICTCMMQGFFTATLCLSSW